MVGADALRWLVVVVVVASEYRVVVVEVPPPEVTPTYQELWALLAP
jgi:hypothetical protein